MEEEAPVIIFDEYGPVRMIRTREWKYVARIPCGPDELYDLVNDPGETRNLIDDPAATDARCRLRAMLTEWFAEWVDPRIDGAREANTGYGQLCRPGIYSGGKAVFAEEERIRSAVARAVDGMELKTGKQP